MIENKIQTEQKKFLQTTYREDLIVDINKNLYALSRLFNKEITEEILEIWMGLIEEDIENKKYTWESLNNALKKAFRVCKYFPSYAEIYNLTRPEKITLERAS